jgi:peptidoglycan hydrolase-like protein with peptidoglycan-binding domain
VGIQYYCDYYDGSATQRRGSKGNAVRKEFQRGWQIKDDGIVGPVTWDRMRWGV